MTQHKPFSDFLKKYKHEHKCQICGEEADCCLEFHHINPKEKLFSLRSVMKVNILNKNYLLNLTKLAQFVEIVIENYIMG